MYILFNFKYLETKSHFTYMKEKTCCSKIKIIILYIVKCFFSITRSFEEHYFGSSNDLKISTGHECESRLQYYVKPRAITCGNI